MNDLTGPVVRIWLRESQESCLVAIHMLASH
jgi:hypothetical protein